MSIVEEDKCEISYTNGKPIYYTQEEINGNWYLIHVRPPTNEVQTFDESIFVEIWALSDGSKAEIPDSFDYVGLPKSNTIPHENLVSEWVPKEKFIRSSIGFDTFVSNAINTAVCTFEEKEAQKESFMSDISTAISANKNVHGSI